MTDLVLDAWAIVAWLKRQQPQAQKVSMLLKSAEHRERKLLMNIVNPGEVFYISVKARNQAYGTACANADIA